jgi:hypothetical protein
MALSVPSLAKECIEIEQAPNYIGKNVCVRGKILRVVETESGTSTFLNFCEDYRKCPFTVVVFDRDLALVGDVRALAGQDIEIFGKIGVDPGFRRARRSAGCTGFWPDNARLEHGDTVLSDR